LIFILVYATVSFYYRLMQKSVLLLFPSSVSSWIIESEDKVIPDDFEFIKTSAEDESSTTVDVEVLNSYPKLSKVILDNFTEYALNYFTYEQEFKITTSWITKISSNKSTNFHNHKNCFYSGVYYFEDYEDDSGKIEFRNPLTDLSSYHIIPKEYNLASALSWTIPPQKNLLIFFPSYLYHRVSNHFSKKERFSLAFNIAPTGSYGIRDSTFM